jgi:anthranilate synthase/aminodeoxychorismate synthase-like glutamine amidotransferase
MGDCDFCFFRDGAAGLFYLFCHHVFTKIEKVLQNLKKIVIIDNYDSFTYNLYQFFANEGSCSVFRNDEITISELKKKDITHLVISPGPGRPEDSKVSIEAVQFFKDKIPVLGVCLGMQLMAYLNGGKIEKHPPVHGLTEKIFHINAGIHCGMAGGFPAARYNSLCVTDIDETKLEITARGESGFIMGLRDRLHPNLEGVQYHPESFLTENGIKILENFLKL